MTVGRAVQTAGGANSKTWPRPSGIAVLGEDCGGQCGWWQGARAKGRGCPDVRSLLCHRALCAECSGSLSRAVGQRDVVDWESNRIPPIAVCRG